MWHLESLVLKMKFLRVFFAAQVVLVQILRVRCEVTDSAACFIPAIYNFGDSNSDTGGIAAAFYPMGPPNGETFFGRPAGRASDGRLIIDFIADHLGLPHLSAYLDSIKPNFEHGANFATGGATIRRQNESWFEHGVSPFPLDIQVEHFDQFKARTTYLYNQASDRSGLPRPEDFSKALYIIDIGQNDLAAGFRSMSIEQIRATIPDIINDFDALVQQLHAKGAQSFWIHNTGPSGCLPIETVRLHEPVPGYLDQNGCIKDKNEIATEFNKQLKDRVIQLRAKLLPQAALTYVDMYSAKTQLISDAKNQGGFESASNICCGYYKDGIDIRCGGKAIVNGTEIKADSCTSPSKVISWDGVHYTEAANHWIAHRIVTGSFSDPPIPITQACYKHL